MTICESHMVTFLFVLGDKGIVTCEEVDEWEIWLLSILHLVNLRISFICCEGV